MLLIYQELMDFFPGPRRCRDAGPCERRGRGRGRAGLFCHSQHLKNGFLYFPVFVKQNQLLKGLTLIFLYAYECFVCLYLFTISMQFLVRLQEGAGSPGTGILSRERALGTDAALWKSTKHV